MILFMIKRMRTSNSVLSVLFSVMVLVFSLERVTTPVLAIGKATIAACQFFTVIDAPHPDKGHLKDPDVSATQDIVFKDVTFAYPSRPHVKILDGLNLNIEAGKITAIVGPSGSGKSTIVGLIERWYTLQDQIIIEKAVEGGTEKANEKKEKAKAKEEEKKRKNPKKKSKDEEESDVEKEKEDDPMFDESGPVIQLSGSVSTAGHGLDEIELKWWRSQIGLVQQEPFLFNESVYTNVANGLVGSQWENESEEKKMELVKEACKEAFADEFIDKLPKGYHTLVGDSGTKLSGGQRQRIAIARSIVRKPSILILDEATSAIDVRGERIVQAALDRVAKSRTTITIAHRLSTIRKADRIIVLKKGQVVETGTHETLMTVDGGVYANLVNAQALSLGQGTEDEEDIEGEDDEDDALSRKRTEGQEEGAESAKEALTTRKNFFTSFGRLFYETKNQWWLMALGIFFTAVGGAAMPLQAWLFAQVINIFQYQGEKLASESRFWGGMFGVFAGGAGIGYFGSFLFATRVATYVRAKYQQEYFESIIHQKASFFDAEEHSHGTITSQTSSDPQRLEEMMGANMASVFIAIWNIIGSVTISFAFGWKLALVANCVILPVLLGSAFWRFKYEIHFEEMNNEVFAESSKFASESIGAFRTVTSLTLEDSICDRFEKLLSGHVTAAYKKARWVSFLFGLADSITMPCQALIFYYGGQLLLKGEYSIISFFVVSIAILNAGQSAGQSLSFGPNAAQVTGAATRILDMRANKVPVDDSRPKDVPDAEGGFKIELQDIHFKYPTRETPVFQGLSLTIEKGQFAALVGASGCGKTSIISLLERCVFTIHVK